MNLDDQFQIDSSLLVGDFQVYKDVLQCGICFNIVVNPKSCQECNSLFCEKCLLHWTEMNKTCPSCRHELENINQPLKLNRIIRDLLNLVKLKCKFHHLGCTDEILYENYKKHYVDECKYVKFYCMECYQEGDLEFMKSHECSINCQHCNKKMHSSKKQAHLKVCKLRSCKCQCGKEMLWMKMYNHMKFDCPKAECECQLCTKVDNREYMIRSHNKIDCVDNYVGNLRRQQGITDRMVIEKMFKFMKRLDEYEIGQKISCLKEILNQFNLNNYNL